MTFENQLIRKFCILCNLTGAVNKLLQYECELSGARIQEENIPLPLTDKQQVRMI